jgi:hypothetical protein
VESGGASVEGADPVEEVAAPGESPAED